ncbi:helix-turn-helix domain-containing protein [Metabacillus fastidiosus]|uniref:helix-turn-helix domain-containing protein n=1 Tax=Metabacillus fastidiosus TaxID=1458 RepID=UPI003D2AAA6F
MSILAERLRKLRKEHKLSQKDVADFLGISESGYGYYEQDRNEPSIKTLRLLANKYSVSVAYLTGETDDPSSVLKREAAEELYDDPDFQHAMRSAQGFSEENKKKILDYIEMIEELEKGRKPGDKQPRRKR